MGHIRLYIIVVFLIINLTGKAQDFIMSNYQDHLYLLNPSSVSSYENTTVSLFFRDQWPGAADFVTYNATAFHRFEDFKSNVGLQFIRDDQGKGIITNTGIAAYYAYKTQVTRNYGISLGMAFSYNFYRLDFHKLSLDPSNPFSINHEPNNYFDINLGGELILHENTRLGLSVIHAYPPITKGSANNMKFNISYKGSYPIYATYRKSGFSIDPLLITSIQGKLTNIYYGTNLSYYNFLGGVYLRQNIDFKFNSMAFLLGYNISGTKIVYTYDINFLGANSNFYNLASHEVTFVKEIKYKKINRRKKGAIKCPKF